MLPSVQAAVVPLQNQVRATRLGRHPSIRQLNENTTRPLQTNGTLVPLHVKGHSFQDICSFQLTLNVLGPGKKEFLTITLPKMPTNQVVRKRECKCLEVSVTIPQ